MVYSVLEEEQQEDLEKAPEVFMASGDMIPVTDGEVMVEVVTLEELVEEKVLEEAEV